MLWRCLPIKNSFRPKVIPRLKISWIELLFNYRGASNCRLSAVKSQNILFIIFSKILFFGNFVLNRMCFYKIKLSTSWTYCLNEPLSRIIFTTCTNLQTVLMFLIPSPSLGSPSLLNFRGKVTQIKELDYFSLMLILSVMLKGRKNWNIFWWWFKLTTTACIDDAKLWFFDFLIAEL